MINKKVLRTKALGFLHYISAKPNKKLARAVEIFHCALMFSFLGFTIASPIFGVIWFTSLIGIIILSNYICGCCPLELLSRRFRGKESES